MTTGRDEGGDRPRIPRHAHPAAQPAGADSAGAGPTGGNPVGWGPPGAAAGHIDVDVLVVGAGPTGLTAACEAIRHGLSVRIADRKAPRSAYSKALVVHARTRRGWPWSGPTATWPPRARPGRPSGRRCGNRPP